MKGTEMDFAMVNPIMEGFGEERVAAALYGRVGHKGRYEGT